MLAGIAGVPPKRFLAVTSLANLGVSLVYAVAEAMSATAGSFFAALAAAVLLPLGFVGLRRQLERSQTSQ
jgi:uncharacterized membrane protein YdjX (TVP38/TMEM64 family)